MNCRRLKSFGFLKKLDSMEGEIEMKEKMLVNALWIHRREEIITEKNGKGDDKRIWNI